MKKSCVQTIVLLALIISGSFYQNITLKKAHTTVDKQLDEVVLHLAGGDFRSAQTAYSDFKKQWNGDKKFIATVLSHDLLESIDRHSARLRASLNNDGQAEGIAVASELREMISEMKTKFNINLQNIL